MSTTDERYLTVAEAAERLRVAPSTIRRWIREGDLPAYRIGKRRVALNREEVEAKIVPVNAIVRRTSNPAMDEDILEIPKLTPEEIRQGLEALERLQRHSKEILAPQRGKSFPPSWKVLNELRDERTRQLG